MDNSNNKHKNLIENLKNEYKIPFLLKEINKLDNLVYSVRHWNITLKELKEIEKKVIKLQNKALKTYKIIEKYFEKNNISFWWWTWWQNELDSVMQILNKSQNLLTIIWKIKNKLKKI